MKIELADEQTFLAASNDVEKTEMTKLEQLQAVRDYVDENPIDFTVNGQTESDEQTFIHYYNLRYYNLYTMLPAMLKAMALIEIISRMETDGEIQERTEMDERMSGDDAAETLSNLIESARLIEEEL